MPNRIYLGEIGEKLLNNPLENTNYLNILGLLPTLSTEIRKRVIDLLNQKYNIVQKDQLYSNKLAVDYQLECAQKQLIHELYELEKLTQVSKNIVIFGDDCFTNTLLIKLVEKILGEKNFERFVSLRPLDLSQPCDSTTFQLHQNSLAIFGGSLNDTDKIDSSYYTGYLPELIKGLGDDFDPLWLNNRIMGVCFGQQYIANILGIINNNTSSIIATYRGMAQFGPSNCTLQDYKYISRLHQELLFGVSNFGKNNHFSTHFTRTGYVDFDLLKTGYLDQVVPLIKDEITGSIVGWSTKNGNILGVQFHPEVSFFHDRQFLKENIESILPYLSQYKNYDKLIGNFNFESAFQQRNQRDIGEHFYTFAMLAYIKSIKERYIHLYMNVHPLLISPAQPKNIDYQEALNELTTAVRLKIDTILAISSPGFDDTTERLTFLKKIDESGRLLLNSILDWKVNRGQKEISEILGFKDIGVLLEKQVDFIQKQFPDRKVYFFRDWGAGDGSLLKDLYTKYKGKNILFYGVGDYIYFDIYPSLKLKSQELGIPEEVTILLFEEFLGHYEKYTQGNISYKVQKAFEDTKLDKIQKIHNSSITSNETHMYSSEGEHDISPESIEYIQTHHLSIIALKNYIIDNFYSLFEGYFERIYVSKFSDFDLLDSVISKVDFQVAIRSTSHVDSREYMKIISDYIEKTSNPGSIYIDNGIQRSYTRITRTYELKEVLRLKGGIKASLVYDEKTNYFTSAIIQKAPFHSDDFFLSELNERFKLVSLEEACNATFFKLDYFIRNFIIRNFKNYAVFWDFHKEIKEALLEIMDLIAKQQVGEVGDIVLNLINYIATHYKNDNIHYDLVVKDILDSYSIRGETLQSILSKEIYIPDWMNLKAEDWY